MEFTPLFLAASLLYGLPPGLLDAVCFVESRHSPEVIHSQDGGSSSYGLCQIKLSTARDLGFKGRPSELLQPKVNINYAGKYLAYQLERYQGDVPRALCAYNKGFSNSHGGNEYTAKVIKRYFDAAVKGWEVDPRRGNQ